MVMTTIGFLGIGALVTTAEATGYETTGRYAEAVALCDAFEAADAGRARCVRFGTTPEGQEMVALVVSGDGTLDPKAARVLIEGRGVRSEQKLSAREEEVLRLVAQQFMQQP